ncbi:GSCFA domain-containing protein [Propylenella binzhouense]|uniref:GSCFA domain-containing protein n=1 Tax=Propylenella binzhouense TaxID=2555902 RepID=A0A964WUK4_9HYPH|nr:GSCFA domain-containing protein [Propylenella binzhouense]MYZ48935.1 hypothetical protein [Propylenella binzhouense]
MLHSHAEQAEELDGLFPTVPAQSALRMGSTNPQARMPVLFDEEGASWDFATPTPRPSFKLEPGESLFTIGSCFARGVEQHLAGAGFDLPTLRFTVPPEERTRAGRSRTGCSTSTIPIRW